MGFEILEQLTDIYGPSSREYKVSDFIKKHICDYVDELYVDNLGNLIARKGNSGEKIMIAAHMDEIGLMVTDVDENGFIRFTNVGGVSPVASFSQMVIFENGTQGIIHTERIEAIKDITLDKLFIDIGSKSKEETLTRVRIGDICVFERKYLETETYISSNSMDDRIGCFILMETIKKIASTENTLYFVFTVQEEVGLRGAKTSAYGIDPDIGISIDVTMAGDTPKQKNIAMGIGKGPAIKVKDNSVICHPEIVKRLVDVAKSNEIPYQMEVLTAGGTDIGAIHLNGKGVPSGGISISTRYIHTTVETIEKNDVLNAIKLLTAFIK